MRRNGRIVLKDFLTISHSITRCLLQGNQRDMTTVMSYTSMTKFSFSPQSLDMKYKSHLQLNNLRCICNIFPALFPQIDLTLPITRLATPIMETSAVVIPECYFLNYPAAFLQVAIGSK